MADQAHSTPFRAGRGSIRTPPVLTGDLKAVAEVVATWPDVVATSRSHFAVAEQDDGIDFRVGKDDLGHMHFDGSIHLASGRDLGAALVAEGWGRPSPWARGWLEARIDSLGVTRAVALFRRNYDRLRPPPRKGEAGLQATLPGPHPE